MPSIKEFNKKIKSLKNTRKITKTMKMISASKLRKAQEAQSNAKAYAQNIVALITRISASVEKQAHPLLIARPVKNVHVLIVTSDKGLCGAFNHNANRGVLRWMNENKQNFSRVDVSSCGKRGFMFFRRLNQIKNNYENVINNPKFEDAIKIGNEIIRGFTSGEHDEVYITYNQFLSPLSQKTILEKILPIDPKALIKDEPVLPTEYIFEPNQSGLLDFLIPHYLYFKIYFALLENAAGEHGARMAAMDNATKNSSDLIDRNTLRRNRARQAAITTELTEIVAGAEAIK